MAKRKSSVSEEGEHDSEQDIQSPAAVEPQVAKKSKKPKTEKSEKKERSSSSKGAATQILKNAEGDSYIEIGSKKRVCVRSFKGKALIDIREYYGSDGDEKPGKKGIALSVDQWEALRANMSIIDKMLQDMPSK